MRTTKRIHDELPEHAFDCGALFQEVWSEVIRDGGSAFDARREATIAHNRRIEWTRANVGLD